ncbi:4Fe-4S dicluster domain-containing protein [Candidatus Woesearchaeota archaeon]|nr:4Fe-4S dicluster domain-containing protein [Candidatus Woesearchaeota archaeon]
MQKIIICDTDKCTGCRICEYVCAAVNSNRLNPRLARIRTIRKEPVFDLALSCRKCENPNCINVCANNAITQDKKTGTIVIDDEKCDGCGMCVNACNFGVLTINLEGKAVYVCDFCLENDKKACIEYCPKEALSYTTIDNLKEPRVKKFHSKLREVADS